MVRTLIRPFKFKSLKLSALLECSKLLLGKALTPDKAQAVGLGKAYEDLTDLNAKFETIMKRNAALFETEALAENVEKLRRMLGLVDSSLRVALDVKDSDKLEAAKAVSYFAEPYLKGRHKSAMLELLGDAEDMCQAFQDPVNAPKAALLGLTEQVEAIKELASQCDTLVDIRGEEKEYRKKLGTASKARTALEKQYRFIFTSILPAIYYNTTDTTVKNNLVAILDHINATLDSFRHLTGENSGSGNDDYGDPNKPDMQPADPPNGGTYIDPNA